MAVRYERFVDTENTLVARANLTWDFPHATKASNISFESVLRLLNDERRANILYNKVWKEAAAEYELKKGVLRRQSAKEVVPKECHIAIIAYTLDTSVVVNQETRKLYQDFNYECRKLEEHKSWEIFPYKSLYCLLLRSIHGVESKPSIDTVVYRGVNFQYRRNDFIPHNDLLYNFNQHSSFSADVRVAQRFKGCKGTIFVLQFGAMAACGIQTYSVFPDEKEVLVFPWSTFTIADVDRSNPSTHLIHLFSEGPYYPGLPYTITKK